MDLAAAMQIVYDLAEQNALTANDDNADDLQQEIADQKEALNIVHDFIVNQLGDD